MLTSGSTPPTRDISVGCSTDESLRSRVASTVRMISGEVRSMTAIRWATSACCSGGRPESSSDALSAVMWASTSAMTCGCSSAMKERSWAGSARCRNWNGICIAAALSRSMISAARSAPSDCSRSCWAKPRPPCGDVGARREQVAELVEHRLALGGAERVEAGDLGGDRLDLGLATCGRAPRRPAPGRAGSARWRPCGRRVGGDGGCAGSSALHQPAAQQRRRRPRADARPGRRARRASRSAVVCSASSSARAAAGRLDRRPRGRGRLLLPQLLDDVRRGLLALPWPRRAALEPGQEQDQRRRRHRGRRCGSGLIRSALFSAAAAALSSAAAASSAVRSKGMVCDLDRVAALLVDAGDRPRSGSRRRSG